MDLTMVDLGLLADPGRCAEVETAALETARVFAKLPALLERRLSSDELAARAEFIRLVAAHWPADPNRPDEITALVQRYGEPD
jgi:hypothetical protein